MRLRIRNIQVQHCLSGDSCIIQMVLYTRSRALVSMTKQAKELGKEGRRREGAASEREDSGEGAESRAQPAPSRVLCLSGVGSWT